MDCLQVADYLPVIERLYENPSFPERERAALLASKVAFCLCDYVGALHLALSAGALFDLTPRTCPATIGPQDEQYVNKMIEQALDTYKTAKRGAATVDKRLETLIDRIFERNLQRREFRYVIGLGLDTRRVDMIERAVKESVRVSLISTVQFAPCRTTRRRSCRRRSRKCSNRWWNACSGAWSSTCSCDSSASWTNPTLSACVRCGFLQRSGKEHVGFLAVSHQVGEADRRRGDPQSSRKQQGPPKPLAIS
jgi:hypothetical protein